MLAIVLGNVLVAAGCILMRPRLGPRSVPGLGRYRYPV